MGVHPSQAGSVCFLRAADQYFEFGQKNGMSSSGTPWCGKSDAKMGLFRRTKVIRFDRDTLLLRMEQSHLHRGRTLPGKNRRLGRGERGR